MTLYKQTNLEGRIPLTKEEEAARIIEVEKVDAALPERKRQKAIRIAEQELEINGIERIIDSMSIDQRKHLPLEMQEQYDELKNLRGKHYES